MAIKQCKNPSYTGKGKARGCDVKGADVRICKIVSETKETLKNPFFGINLKLSEPPKTDDDFENRKYTG